ncbi:hypothetical protein HN011_009553 [Eciton burchellii]|nr:hypothetical protein HN011_009553 [Eciton burchellii]
MIYDNKHKIVLQTIIHKGALSENEGKKLIMELFDHNNIVEIIGEINAKLKPLSMIIKCTNCEITGQLYWIFVNIVQDVTFGFDSEFTQAELTLLRNVYSEIITSDDNYVSSTWCLNLCSSLNLKLTKANAEQFLHEMINRKWLFCKDGKYYMGVRSIVELHQYFRDTYEDNLRACTLCKQILFYGKKCDKCDTITHIYCLKDYTMNHSLGCPNCHSILESDNPNNYDNTMDVDMDPEMTIPAKSNQKKKLQRRYKN